ncbi:hypothetical protein M758_8G064200 [Ceratodon purpureus]|nr:hypothetical protein M758_8G064200 [Ceratodon purpureus]
MAEGGELKSGAPCSSDTLDEAALKVLLEGDPWLKAEYGDLAATLWLEGKMESAYRELGPVLQVPSRPARLDVVRLVAPRDMPKLGRGGSLQSRQALVHSLVHTESWAIDLSWDIIARFGKAEAMPREFFDDFVRVAQDEGRHFRLLAARLKEMNSSYGALPAHDGLWDSAEATAHDLKARLAVEHCVHEARGLDVLPTTVSRFRKGGDEETAKLLESVIYPEEITHCAAGVKWFSYLCLRDAPKDHSGEEMVAKKLALLDLQKSSEKGLSTEVVSECQNGDGLESLAVSDVVAAFHDVVRKYFRGPLKPPFNEAARAAAGFGPEWYLPLATKVAAPGSDHLR